MNAAPESTAPDTPGATSQDTAATLRKRLLSAREALTVTQRQAASAAIVERLRAELATGAARAVVAATGGRRPVLAAFWPIGSEPDLRELLHAWSGEWTIALPRVARRAAPLDFHVWSPEAAMTPGAYGIPEPDGPACTPDVLLVPTLGFTARADRIGYGGGYYDRTLAALRAQDHPHVAIGVAFACGALAPGEHVAAAHDAPLDAVVTEEGWVYRDAAQGVGV